MAADRKQVHMESFSFLSTKILVLIERRQHRKENRGKIHGNYKTLHGSLILREQIEIFSVVGVPLGPISFTSSAWYAVDPCVYIYLEVCTAQRSFAINPWHCSYLVHWMLKAHQSSFTVEHKSCTPIIRQFNITLAFSITVKKITN